MNYYFERMFNSNGFDILVKENKLRSEFLSDEDKSILKKLVCRLSASKLSAFDVQISQKDFIGMALEAEQRGETLSSVIGNDMNAFCEEIISNGRKKSWKEALMLVMPTSLLWLILAYGIIYILYNSCPTIMKITLNDCILLCLIAIPFGSYLSGRVVFESTLKRTLLNWILLESLVLIVILKAVFGAGKIVLFEVIGWVPLAVIGVLLIVSYFLRNNYLRRLAKRYNWSD